MLFGKRRKEVALFTQDSGRFMRGYFIRSQTTADRYKKKAGDKLYGVVTGMFISANRFPRKTTVSEIRTYFRQAVNFSSFVTVVYDIKDARLGFAVERKPVKDLYEGHGLVYISVADVVLYAAYRDYAEKDGVYVVGYLDRLNGFLVYELVGNGTLQQFVQRRSLAAGIPGASAKNTAEAIEERAKEILEEIVRSEKERTDKPVEYVIAGLNDGYDRILRVATDAAECASFHKEFIDEKRILLKKALVLAAGVGLLADFSLVPRYMDYKDKISDMRAKLQQAQAYIKREDETIRRLYMEKGKTIILQDRIDLAKLSKILHRKFLFPPSKSIFKTDKNNIEVDFIYSGHNILAQEYYRELKKDRRLKVSFFINPTFNISKVHVEIPKEVLK